MGTNVAQVLRQGALRTPRRVAVVELSERADRRTEFTYAELDERAQRVAASLLRAGLGPGDRLALTAENGIDFAAAWFGALYAGCVLVPVPIHSAPAELAFRLQHAGCRAVLCDGRRKALSEAAARAVDPVPQVLDVLQLGAPEGQHLPIADTGQEQPAVLLYTSGTTGQAKGAAISHGALLTHTAVLAYHALRLTEEDTVLGVLPLTHSFGCRMVLLSSLYAGARTVLMPRFVAAVAMDVMLREEVTWLPVVPTMLVAFGQLPPGPAPKLRWVMCAGAPLADAVARRAEARLGAEVRQGFGMTEATIATLNAPPDRRVLGSVGKPVWGIELRIAGRDGRDVPEGQPGEIWIRGHNTMSHYLDDPRGTAATVKDGFVQTGDIGCLDTEGHLFIVDRKKDLILVGGNNVYPAEVENVLGSHPAVAEVAVVGRPHPYYGEEVVAVVVCRPGAAVDEATLIAWASERLARTKVPRAVVFWDALPLGPSGKVLKRLLRDQLSVAPE